MSYIGDSTPAITSQELEALVNLTALATSTATQAIQKTSATTFANVDIETALGDMLKATYDPANGARQVAFLDQIQSSSGTVTSVAAITLGTTGTDLSSSVVNGTTTPVITLQVPTASATNRGALSAADWSTFNGKQAALGYTAENTTNKVTSISGASTDTQYPSAKLTYDQLALKSNVLIPTALKTSAYNAVVGDFISCDTTGGTFTVTLPSAPADKSVIGVKMTVRSATGVVNVNTSGTDVFNKAGGTTSIDLSTLNYGLVLQYESATGIWYPISSNTPPSAFAVNFPGIDAKTPITNANVSLDTTTRVLTITPPLGYFYIYLDGNGIITRHLKTGNVAFPAFTDTSGKWHFYFDVNGDPQVSQSEQNPDITIEVWEALWNATETGADKLVVSVMETHLNTIPLLDHKWKHLKGSVHESGFTAINNLIASGTPNADGRNAVFALTTGSNIDDNLEYTVTNGTGGGQFEQDMGNTTAASLNATNGGQFVVRYQDGAGLAKVLPATRFPFAWDTGTDRPEFISSTGVRTLVTAGNFFVYYITAVQDPRTGKAVKVFSETVQYNTLTLAQASSWGDITSQFALLSDELKPLYKMIFQYQSGYDAGTKKTALREVLDLRRDTINSLGTLSGSLPASSVTNVPAGSIASTNVQSALDELDTEKLAVSGAGTAFAIGSTGLAGGQTIAGSTLTAENLTLRANAADLTTGAVIVTSSKEASSSTVGSVQLAGGLAVAKRVFALDMTVTNTITGSITGNAATVTTNANLTGPITSTGNATTVANDIALPGNPTTSTQTPATNNTTIATTAYVDDAVRGGSFGGALQLTGILYPRVIGSNLATGDTDLYTVPAGKRAIILSSTIRAYNPSAGSITYYTEIKVSSTYYRIGPNTTLTTGTGGSGGGPGMMIVLEKAGESISVNCATTQGLNISYPVLEYDAVNPLYSPRVLSLSNGNNTIYTVPAGKSAIPFQHTVGLSSNVQGINNSGGSLNYIIYNVPSGGSAGSTNQIFPSTAIADKGAQGFAFGSSLAAGDFVVVNTSAGTATQTAWVTVYEY